MVWKGRNSVMMKLAELKGSISQMLNYLSLPSKSVILRNLLDEAEYIIMQIPDTEKEMIKDWREHLSEWWAVFAEKCPSKDEDNDESLSTFESKFNVSFFMIEFASSDKNNEFEVTNPTMENVLNFLEHTFVKTESLESLSKAEKLKNLQDLLELVNRAEKYSFAYMNDMNFQSTFLRYILLKLSEEVKTKFCSTTTSALPLILGASCQPTLDRRPKSFSRQNVSRPKTVYNLKDFLIDEIQELNNVLIEEQRIEKLYSGSPPDADQFKNVSNCSFCKMEGHTQLICQKVSLFDFRLQLLN